MKKADDIITRVGIYKQHFLEMTIYLNQEIINMLFGVCSYRDRVNFMEYLQNIYTKKEIIELFESININTIEVGLSRNTIQIFKTLDSRLVYYNRKKTNNNFIELHDEIIRLKLMEEVWLKANPKKGLGAPELPINNTDYYPYGFS